MYSSIVFNLRYWLLGLLPALCAGTVQAQVVPGDPIVEIEVDWEIEIGTPDDLESLPQISLIISSQPNLDSWYAELVLNSYAYAPGFGGDGGIMTRLWDGLNRRTTTYSRQDVTLVAAGEKLLVTQEMSIDQNGVLWSIHQHTSSPVTWGEVLRFGGGTSNQPLTNLDGFSIQTTLDESGVIAGKNRVDRIRVTKVRYYYQSGAVNEESYSEDIHFGLMGTTSTTTQLDAKGDLFLTAPLSPDVLVE